MTDVQLPKANTTNLLHLAGLALSVLLFFWLAMDGRLHWDEPAYLYTGGYLDLGQILAAQYQPSGIDSFYVSRILHVIFIHGLTQLFGTGAFSFQLIIWCYFLLALATLWVTYRLLGLLGLDESPARFGVVACAFSPIFLYLCFKSMPEVPALFFSTCAAYSLLRACRNHAPVWLCLNALCIALAALTKNTMLILYISFALSLLLIRLPGYSRMQLIGYGMVSGLGSLLLFFGFLQIAGIELKQYLGLVNQVSQLRDSLPQRLFEGAMELGAFYLILFLALINRPNKTMLFFLLWFVLATAPVLFLVGHVEGRYLVTNLCALCGIAALLMPGIIAFLDSLRHKWQRWALGAVTLCTLALSNSLILSIMEHEVNYPDIARVVNRLDTRFGGADQYVLLTPWSYTDFHFLRFVYPDHHIYSVYDYKQAMTNNPEEIVRNFGAMRQAAIGDYLVQSPEDLKGLGDRTLIYFGFDENFSIANLRALFRLLNLNGVLDKFGKIDHKSHLSMSWLWDNPKYPRKELFKIGHYSVFQITPR